MNQNKEYTCLKYSEINFLIPKEKVLGASFFNSSDFELNLKNNFVINQPENNLSFINFDFLLSFFSKDLNYTESIKSHTCLKLKNENVLLTSAECFVVTPDDNLFYEPGFPYSLLMKKIGIEKYCFVNGRICFVLDIDAFLCKAMQLECKECAE